MKKITIDNCNFYTSSVISQERINLLNKDNFLNSLPVITIFISSFNETDYIVDTIKSVITAIESTNFSYEILIIDDASVDNTVNVILDFISQHDNVQIVLKVNNLNKGLASNFIDAAHLGQGKYFRMVCGDNVEPVSTLKSIFQMIGTADLVIPYHQDLKGKKLSRRLLSKFYVFLCNLLSGFNLKYYNGLAILKRLDVIYYSPTTSGFGFQAELVSNLLLRGRSYIEVPVSAIELKISTALTVRNFLSTIHVFLNILISRISLSLYKRDI
jgi:glycosyltransferase involved in cell wall biosynthesis